MALNSPFRRIGTNTCAFCNTSTALSNFNHSDGTHLKSFPYVSANESISSSVRDLQAKTALSFFVPELGRLGFLKVLAGSATWHNGFLHLLVCVGKTAIVDDAFVETIVIARFRVPLPYLKAETAVSSFRSSKRAAGSTESFLVPRSSAETAGNRAAGSTESAGNRAAGNIAMARGLPAADDSRQTMTCCLYAPNRRGHLNREQQRLQNNTTTTATNVWVGLVADACLHAAVSPLTIFSTEGLKRLKTRAREKGPNLNINNNINDNNNSTTSTMESES